MPTGNVDHEFPRRRIARLTAAIWWIALFLAVVNVLFMLRRAPILSHQQRVGDEAAVRTAVNWLAHQPSDARLLLLRPHSDFSVWFNYRLNYLIYPRRHDSDRDEAPPGAASRYDLILAIGQTRDRVSSNWTLVQSSGSLSLFSSGIRNVDRAGVNPRTVYHSGLAGFAYALLGIVVELVLGCLLLGWTSRTAPFPSRFANMAVSHLVGATAITWIVTISALIVHRLQVWPVYVLVIMLLPGLRRSATTLFSLRESATGATHVPGSNSGESNSHAKSPNAFIPIGVIVLGIIGWLVSAHFMGVGWDGYSIWQLKSQAFLIDGNLSILRDSHFADYSHLDYPLLVPLQTWWLGIHAGGYSELWAEATGVLFALDMAVLFAAFASRWVRTTELLVGSAILVTLPILTAHAVSGFADIEMSCYLLALGVFISQFTVCEERSKAPVVMWLLGGIVLVKNEGMLAAVGGLAVIAIMDRRKSLKALASGAIAAVMSYLPWLALKHNWQLKNDLLEGGKNPHFTVGLILWRIGVALKGFTLCIAQTGPRAGGWGIVAVLIPIGLISTVIRRVAVCYPIWLLCALQTVGYVCIYVITPHAAQDHITHSVDRLTLHLVPAMLLAALIGTFGEGFQPTKLPE